MLDRNELAQVHRTILAEMAQVEAAAHNPCHGSYRYLCACDGVMFYAHRPVGLVLHQFSQEVRADEVLG